jgi:hypothetical protein
MASAQSCGIRLYSGLTGLIKKSGFQFLVTQFWYLISQFPFQELLPESQTEADETCGISKEPAMILVLITAFEKTEKLRIFYPHKKPSQRSARV